ncbi:NIPSNAP family protein [Pleomorphomonas carboxyditropha]|uniref:NIPSNAP family protein n=1 Tax=Pleomorphomonas carboxyditropha TaxID=2023338 RepID=A0A2G9WRL2_9HYPH|nr:NIPSNAP family protein [Pleomorphomonas carboxyditropha]PIO97349.1 NIPSNAP family protein [Pleomorphomonas carboxyditropha]
MPQLIEILLYKLKPGTGGDFFEIMQNVSVPLHRRNGIDVIWNGQSMHDPDAYGLIRGFADMAALEEEQSRFYASEAWKTGPREAIIARIETATKIIVPMNDDAVKGLRKQGYHAFATGG